MSSLNRPRRIASSAINTPTVVHVKKDVSIASADVESLLTRFIDASEASAGSDASTDGTKKEGMSSMGLDDSGAISAALSQLKRVQRNLRGLPPLAAELNTNPDQPKKTKFEDYDASEEPKNKKIKFSDDDFSEAAKPIEQQDNETRVENTSVDDIKEESEEDNNGSSTTSDMKQLGEKSSKKGKEKKSKKEKSISKENKKEEKERKEKKEKKEKKHRKHKEDQ